MTGSKKRGDYCWSIYGGTATADPWYLGGAQHQPAAPEIPAEKPADPSPEDSGELEPVRDS